MKRSLKIGRAGVSLVLAVAATATLLACGRATDAQPQDNSASIAPAVRQAGPQAEIPIRRPSRGDQALLPDNTLIGVDPDPQSPVLTFLSDAPPRDLLGWYRADARRAAFAVDSELQEGSEHVLSGRIHATGERFTVRIAPGAARGTVGTIIIAGR